MSKMLSLTYVISQYLQKESIDLCSAMNKIELVEKTFVQLRKDGQQEFALLYKKSVDLASKIGVFPSVPRTVEPKDFVLMLQLVLVHQKNTTVGQCSFPFLMRFLHLYGRDFQVIKTF